MISFSSAWSKLFGTKPAQPVTTPQQPVQPAQPVPAQPQVKPAKPLTVAAVATHEKLRWRDVAHSLLHFTWTKKLVYWMIITAGTMSELVFLVGSLWISINASVHQFVLNFLSEDMTTKITQLATTGYVALPECILGLAFILVLKHFRLWCYDKRQWSALTWSFLYALPTAIFLLLSVITLGSSVANVTFQLPKSLLILRAIAGYFFGFIAFLYEEVGKPQEVNRLQLKDVNISKLRDEVQRLKSDYQAETAKLVNEHRNEIAKLTMEYQAERNRVNAELNEVKSRYHQTLNDLTTVQSEIDKSSRDALEAYSDECINWLKAGHKSVNVDEVTVYTGHSKRKLNHAITAGKLRTASRNHDLIMVDSLVNWLRENVPN